MTQMPTVEQGGNLPVILRILLAVVCLLPAAVGLVIIGAIFATFVHEGMLFTGTDEIWMQLFLGGAAILVLVPAIAIGMILRFARWKKAPQASLVLALVVGGAGALASGMLQSTVVPGDTESDILVMAFSIAGIAIGALPPFLHWWHARTDA